jgi:YD repeat-containing protein
MWFYGYDDNGNLTGQTDAKSQVTTNTYDGLDRLVGQTFAGATTATFTYDPVGNQLTELEVRR